MVNGWSRLAVDPERFLDPEIEEMEVVAMGAVYTRTSHGRQLRDLQPGKRGDLLQRHFHPYHAALTDLVVAVVTDAGLDHAENTPFAGTFVPTHHLGDPRVSSVMLEIRRDTYLDEDTARQHAGAARVRGFVTDCVASCQRRDT